MEERQNRDIPEVPTPAQEPAPAPVPEAEAPSDGTGTGYLIVRVSTARGAIPLEGAQKVCDCLEKDNVFLVPMKKGIRLAVCSVSKEKMKGLAAKLAAAIETAGVKQ